jgi:integrase
MGRQQARRGTVAVEEFRGMLRLRWSYAGKRYTLATGYPDSKLNRVVATEKAKAIEGDMMTGNFDQTLGKYRPPSGEVCNGVTVVELFSRFRSYKFKTLYKQSMGKIDALNLPLKDFFGDKAAALVDQEMANHFGEYLSDRMSPATLKARLTTLNACWQWGMKQKLVTENPWSEAKQAVKVPQSPKPTPFTQAEARAIVQGFRESRYYRHYADFVEFFLSTGCRPGEIIALTWGRLADHFSVVSISEAMVRGGTRKPPKTARGDRRFKLPARVQAMLKARYSGQNDMELVFPAPRGGHIDDNNFRSRAWKSVLKEVGVPYRYPYTCRHTFISHALNQGTNFLKVADIAGHDPKVMLDRYASSIGELEAPDFLSN